MSRHKHVCSLKTVSKNIDKNWKFDEKTKRFSHPSYKGRFFTAICDNSEVENVYELKDEFDKITRIRKKEFVSSLYPHIDTDDDPKNIGYNFCKHKSSQHFTIISNKMNSYWDTYKGKRYIKYIEYRKVREENKRAWLELHPPKKTAKKPAKPR